MHTVLCKSNANTCGRNSAKFLAFRRILDRNETSTTFPRIFEACIVLNGSNFRRQIPWWRKCDSKFRAKIRSMWRIFGAKIRCIVLFILLKKIWLNLWLVTTLCNTPIKFPATIPVSARPILFATMATQVVVSMRLGSFMYSTFDSNHGKSFKLF